LPPGYDPCVTAILGLNAYHGDAAAALVVDGELVAAAEEERFNRVKHSAGFPSLAAAWCLEDAGLTPGDLDHVAIGRDPRANLGQKVARTLRHGVSGRYLRERFANAARVHDVGKALAGGVALNAVANGRVLPETAFEELYIQPAAGDSGIAVGAAYYVWNQKLGQPRGFVMEHAFTGPEYDDDEIRAAIDAVGLSADRLDDDALFRTVAERIAAGDVVGWFQGRMEFGPRALGNRSIVADPRSHEMKDVLNARIKQREPFRPFAPSILAERTGEWFEQDYTSPFMVLVYKTAADKREVVPAVNHVDDTGRVQTVEARVAPRYHRLIGEFERQTGVPILLNTSFNENEPIVMTPGEALDTFLKTKMDVLALGNYLVRRNGA
jgi:predicted NodU family carbamoyl transferase